MFFFENAKKKQPLICRKMKALCMQLTISHLNEHLYFPYLTPENAVFGFSDISDKDYSIVNQLLLLFKYYIYNATNRKHLSLKLQ